jgi:UDP-2,3-diacylglucosamine pyrophosphatase LpxH
MAPISETTRWRSLFISDVHLGTRGCRAEMLAEFLRTMRTDQLFLLGDIVDFENMRRRVYWPAAHEEVVRVVTAMAAAGTRVVYVPGNHDESLRYACGSNLGPVEVHRTLIHETASGERLLLTHGDEFDVSDAYSPTLANIAEMLYRSLLRMSVIVHAGRAFAGLPHWSLLTCLKWKLRKVREAVARFEMDAAIAASSAGLDGVVCGHIHRPSMQRLHGIRYINTGDWVEHCTALAEHADGRLELLDWTRARSAAPALDLRRAARAAA